jgi:protein SCO1
VLACVIFMPSTLGWTTATAHDAAAKNAVVSALPGSQGAEKQGEPERHRRTGKASDRFPNIALRTQDNRPVRFYDDLVKDRIVIINFMYTTCSDICPGTTQNLVDVYESLAGHVGRDMLMLSISIDPEVDTPDALTRYAEIFEGPKPGWLFLTGDYADIDRLRRSLGVYDLDPIIDADKTQHAGIVTFGNDRTNRWAALPAMMDWRELAKTILRITREPKRKHRGD